MTDSKERQQTLYVATALLLVQFVAFFRRPLIADIGNELDISSGGLGLLVAMAALARLLLDIPAGRMTERISPPQSIAAGGLLVATGTLIMAGSRSSTVAYTGMFVLGAGSAWVLASAMGYFAHARREVRGMAMSVYGVALLAAEAFGPAVSGPLAELAGWRVTLVIGAILALTTSAVILLRPNRIPAFSPPSHTNHTRPAAPFLRNRKRIMAAIFLLPTVQLAIGPAIIGTLIPLVADRELALNSALIGLAMGVGGVGRLIGALVFGRISDRIGRKRALIPGLALQATGLAVFAFGSGVMAWWTCIVLLSLGSISVLVGSTILADVSGHTPGFGNRLGIFRLSGDSAFVIFPILVGAAYEPVGRTIASLPVLALTLAVTLFAIWVIPETRERTQP